jgi:hypothetical protein
VEHAGDVDIGLPDLGREMVLPDRIAPSFSPMKLSSSNSRIGSMVA